MDVRDLSSRDYRDLANALSGGPFLDAVVSFRVEWARSSDKRHLSDPEDRFDADVSITSASAWWRGETSKALYVADDISTSASLFAEVGHERNGVYFPGA